MYNYSETASVSIEDKVRLTLHLIYMLFED